VCRGPFFLFESLLIHCDCYQVYNTRSNNPSRRSKNSDISWRYRICVLYKINDRLALKTPRIAGNDQFAYELSIYNILEEYPIYPDISRSFLRVTNGNFMDFCNGGSLDQRLLKHQTRSEAGFEGYIIRVNKKEPLEIVERWIMELSNASAWLESLGYVHTDIRPANLLLDRDDHLKLTDFDCVNKIGSPALGGAPPWCRLCGLEAGTESNTFGYNGPRVEQFAIGSVLYMMIRGYEPYDVEGGFNSKDGSIVKKLQLMDFPSLGEDPLDKIIDKC